MATRTRLQNWNNRQYFNPQKSFSKYYTMKSDLVCGATYSRLKMLPACFLKIGNRAKLENREKLQWNTDIMLITNGFSFVQSAILINRTASSLLYEIWESWKTRARWEIDENYQRNTNRRPTTDDVVTSDFVRSATWWPKRLTVRFVRCERSWIMTNWRKTQQAKNRKLSSCKDWWLMMDKVLWLVIWTCKRMFQFQQERYEHSLSENGRNH